MVEPFGESDIAAIRRQRLEGKPFDFPDVIIDGLLATLDAARRASDAQVAGLRSAVRELVSVMERWAHHDAGCAFQRTEEIGAAEDLSCDCGLIRRRYEVWALADDLGLDGYSIQASIGRERFGLPARKGAVAPPAVFTDHAHDPERCGACRHVADYFFAGGTRAGAAQSRAALAATPAPQPAPPLDVILRQIGASIHANMHPADVARLEGAATWNRAMDRALEIVAEYRAHLAERAPKASHE